MAAGTTYERVQPLNGGANGRVGTALSLEVSPGDKVKVEVYAKYRNISPTPNPNSFLVALASAFGVSSSSVGDELELYNELSSYAATVSGGDREDDDETSPKVFATILLFDRNYNLVDAGWDQISATANQGSSTSKTFCAHDLITKEVTVKEPGYAYVFISNEHPTFVETYFDDLTITHTQSPIVAGSDYYPFGLVMDDRTITDEAYRYGYQGQFSEKDTTTGWNEFELRFYDAKIARWLTTDPYGQYHSPYVAMGNRPHMSVDPDGGWNWVTAGIGFGVGAIAGYAITGDLEGALIGGLAGGALGGVMFDYSATKMGYSSQAGKHLTPRGFPYAVPSKFAYSLGNTFRNIGGTGTFNVLASTTARIAASSNNDFPDFEGELPYVPRGTPSATYVGIEADMVGDVKPSQNRLFENDGQTIIEDLYYGYEGPVELTPGDNTLRVTVRANDVHNQYFNHVRQILGEWKGGNAHLDYKAAYVDVKIRYKNIGKRELRRIKDGLKGQYRLRIWRTKK